jgi:co-chaperonin GroES (HSP10)
LTEINVESLLIHTPSKVLEPLGDCVVFKPVDADRTKAGLYVPDKVETRKKAVVVAVGPGRLLEDGKRQPMDWIVIWAEAPKPAHVDLTGERLYICHDGDVACRVRSAEGPS